MDHICQKSLPYAPWMAEATRRLPGVQPLKDPDTWLMVDEAYGAQMALRETLLESRRDDVIAVTPGAGAAIAELYGAVLDWAQGQAGFGRQEGVVRCPDGREVVLDPGDKLGTLARLVQEDLCLLQKPEGGTEHILTAAILCFPASWTLAEKIGKPLGAIHRPVAPYDGQMAARVERLFDHLRPETPLWRQNALLYADPALYQPRSEAAPRNASTRVPEYLRSERQVLRRLPKTGAVVFAIHTWVLPFAALTPDQRLGLRDHPLEAAE